MTNFSDAVIAAVTGHMNGDHTEDNLLIARAFGFPDATASTMVGVDGEAGVWRVTDPRGEHELAVPWLGGTISERPEIRREVVALYNAACERLGVSARDEHAPAPAEQEHPHGGHGQEAHGSGHDQGGHGHGAQAHAPGRHGAPRADAETDGPVPFSRAIREGSWSDHSDSEGATFMEDIMRGKGTLQDYIDLVAQHYFMYEALEEVAEQVADDPAFAGLHPAALVRMPALVADLEHLIGPDWRERISPVPSTEAYAARIREIGEQGWVAGVIAHHYTRYLGDLSGGQMIAKRVAKQHDLERRGVEFYDFAELGSPNAFKVAYREGLDRLGELLSDEEKTRMLEEVRTAYGFNTAVFIDLGRARAAA